MKQFKLTGGARIGKLNVTLPFATLTVTENKLELNAELAGNLVFAPQDIISIETYELIPIVGKGVKINHKVDKYKEKVIFWTLKDPKSVIEDIRKTGFLNNVNSGIVNDDHEIIAKQNQTGFPIKKSYTIAAIVLWNVLFLTDLYKFFTGQSGGFPIGIGIKTALALVVITAVITLISKPFRKLILKEGRGLADIQKFLYTIIFIGGTIFLVFNIMGNLAE